jgi:hypothetical protein
MGNFAEAFSVAFLCETQCPLWLKVLKKRNHRGHRVSQGNATEG